MTKRCPATFGAFGVALCLMAVLAVGIYADDSQPHGKAQTAKHVKKKPKGNGTREKETEGTEAPDRFEADTVIKSQYKLNGEQLEVDPD